MTHVFVNLTMNEIRVYNVDGSVALFVAKPEAGTVTAMAATTAVAAEPCGDLPTVRMTYGDVTGLPAPVEGTTYIVSALVINHPAVAGRMDVLAPDTNAPSVWRDGPEGFGVRQFIRPAV